MPGIPGLTDSIQVPVASMTLKNIGNAGGNQNGVAIKDVVLQTATALAAKAVNDSKLNPQVKLVLSQELAALSPQLGSSFATQFQNFAGAALQQAQPKAENAINQLLNGKKK
jgi:hypothetical protein